MAIAYQPSFSPKVRFEWINESWQLFQAQAGTWIVSMLIMLVIVFVLWCIGWFAFGLGSLFLGVASLGARGNLFSNLFTLYALPTFLGLVVVVSFGHAFLMAGLMRMANAQVRGEPISPSMIFYGARVYWNFLGYYIVYILGAYIGLRLLYLIPGCVFCAFFAPGLALVADGVPISQAMPRSLKAMSQDWLMASLFVFVYILIGFIGLIPCGLGLFFIVMPMFYLILALIYRDMIGMPGVPIVGDASGGYGVAQPGVWPPPPGVAPQNPNLWSPSGPLAGSNPSDPSYPPQAPSSDAWPPQDSDASSGGSGPIEPPDRV